MVEKRNGRQKSGISGIVFTVEDDKKNVMALGLGPELASKLQALPPERQEEAEQHIKRRLLEDLTEATLLLSVDIGIKAVQSAID